MTTFAIVASKQDKAGMNIASFIQNLPIYYIEKKIVYAENIDKKIKEDFVIFASKHEGIKPKILSVHPPGNFKQAKLGGKQEKICKTSSTILKTFFQELNKNIPKTWQTTLECTHHGPFIEKPCLFIEIGSNEKDWKDKDAGKAIATTIEQAIEKIKQNKKYQSAIGIGGPHYCPNFNKIQLNSDIAISHIISQYIFPITEQIIKQAIEKTQEKIQLVLLDWKGMKSEQRNQTINLLNKLNLKYKRTSEIKKDGE